MSLFNTTGYSGGYPAHLQDASTGIWYIASAFDIGAASANPTTQDVLIVRTDALGNVLQWADGTVQKKAVSAAGSAGAPSLAQNRYDPEQPLALIHGTRRFVGHLGGEVWTELT